MRSLGLRAGLLIVFIIAFAVAAAAIDLPDVLDVRAWITSLGPVAPLAFVAGYALVVPAPVPKSVLTAIAGVVFGPALGVPLVVAGATTGAMLAFGIARSLGRNAIEAMAHGHLERVDAAVARHGILAALVVRLVPGLPFTVLNYACGVTTMRLRHFALGTALGLLPGTTVVVAFASAGAELSLWIPAAVSVTLGSLSLTGGLLWSRRSRRRTGRAARNAAIEHPADHEK